jgi:hypothetical protein
VVIQALGSSNNRASARGEGLAEGPPQGPGRGATWLTNTCHVWAEGGIGEQLMALGWRPGPDEFPAPSLVELRRRRADEAAEAGDGPAPGRTS